MPPRNTAARATGNGFTSTRPATVARGAPVVPQLLAGRGYAVIGLRDIKNFAPYVAPAGRRLPALSTIVALYYDAATGDRARTGVDIATFMADFHLSAKEFHAYFDSDPDSPGNIDMTSRDPGRPGRTGPPGNPFNAGRRVEGRKQP